MDDKLKPVCRTERVCRLIDLVKRRTPLYFLADSAGLESLPRIVKHVASILGWDGKRQADVLSAVDAEFRADMQACADTGMFLPKLHRETICA